MKKKHVVFLAILLTTIGILFSVKGVMSYFETNMKQLATLTISDVDLAKIYNGTYNGSYKAYPVEAEVSVTVDNHKITGIKILKHKNGQGLAAEKIIDSVIKAQTPKVDVIAGATYSSKTILKAIENALNNTNG